jgi:hypothetical protein
MASHAKKMGKIGIHLGGSLQLLFGIRGKRWENKEYGSSLRQTHPEIKYYELPNADWIRPTESETPKSANNVENACYW